MRNPLRPIALTLSGLVALGLGTGLTDSVQAAHVTDTGAVTVTRTGPASSVQRPATTAARVPSHRSTPSHRPAAARPAAGRPAAGRPAAAGGPAAAARTAVTPSVPAAERTRATAAAEAASVAVAPVTPSATGGRVIAQRVAVDPAQVSRAVAAATAPCGGGKLRKPDGSYWQCAFDDEFSAGRLDTTKWLPQVTADSGYRTGPAATQACYVDSTDNIAVAGGYLRLTARKESAPFVCASPSGAYTTQYTSGMVSTFQRYSQTYGRFEVRAKLPQTTAKGLQETLWLWPVNSVKYYPYSSGEIDFAEFYSQYYNLNVPYVHYTYDSVNTLTSTNTFTAVNGCKIDYTGFNSYALEWLPGKLTISINGTTCLTDNYSALGLSSPAPFDQPFFVALTQALGVGTNAFDPAVTPLPATTLVDYVRTWS